MATAGFPTRARSAGPIVSYLSSGGSPSGPTTTVADGPLNLRAGASTSYDVLEVMPEGATVTLLGSQSNGYTRVSYQGTIGWAATQYLAGGSSSGNTATVIDGALNLRQGASTGYDVILVMPDGATVTLLGATANGYSRVSYQGTIGWAYSAYLSTGGSSGGTATVIDGALNLRALASITSDRAPGDAQRGHGVAERRHPERLHRRHLQRHQRLGIFAVSGVRGHWNHSREPLCL